MVLRYYYDGAELATDRVRLGEGAFTGAAEGGIVAVAGLQIEDPGGTLLLDGLQPFHVVEDACSFPRIWSGYVIGRRVSRGRESHRVDDARVWDSDLIDLNARLSLRVIVSADGKRPAETDNARVTWLLAHSSMAGLVVNAGLANTTDNPINFGEADYRHRFPLDVLTDIAGISGKTFYVYWSGSAAALFYDKPEAAVRNSTLRLSNVTADVDGNTTFAPFVDATLERNPDSTYSGIDYIYQAGSIYRKEPTTEANFIARDQVYQTSRVGLLATAEAQAAAALVASSTERDRLDVTVDVPASKVNLILEGQRLEVKFSHLPGYAAGFTFIRVVRRTVTPIHEDRYRLRLECSSAKLPIPGGGGRHDPIIRPFPHGNPVVAVLECTIPNTGSSGAQCATGTVALTNTATYHFRSDVVHNHDPSDATSNFILSQLWNSVFSAKSFEEDMGAVRLGTDKSVAERDFPMGSTGNFAAVLAHSPRAGTNGAGSTLRMTITYVSGPDSRFENSAGDPGHGQPVLGDSPTPAPNGTTKVFTTTWPYLPGSLRVRVDGVLISSASVSESDPAAGTFSLNWAPDADETITAEYQGA